MADLPVSLPETEQGSTRGQVIVPPRVGERTARRQTVLDEETYTRGLSQIIQRDFFPDLPRLRAQNAYLHALEEGDVGSIESCARVLVREEARAGVLEDMTRRGETGNTLTRQVDSVSRHARRHLWRHRTQRRVYCMQRPGCLCKRRARHLSHRHPAAAYWIGR